jgi:cell division initiation protein
MIDLTPLEVRKKKGDFRRAMRGYDPVLVDDFLDLVADRLEELVRENLTLAERVGRQEHEVAEYRDRERALTEALVSAQEMREEVRRQSQREADLARQSAEQQAARLRADVEDESRRLRADAEQQAAQLLASVQHERQREEDALHHLRARQQEFLSSYRALLEHEIEELGALARTLGARSGRDYSAAARGTQSETRPAPGAAAPTAQPAATSAAPTATEAGKAQRPAKTAAAAPGPVALPPLIPPDDVDEYTGNTLVADDVEQEAALAMGATPPELVVEPFEPEPFLPDADELGALDDDAQAIGEALEAEQQLVPESSDLSDTTAVDSGGAEERLYEGIAADESGDGVPGPIGLGQDAPAPWDTPWAGPASDILTVSLGGDDIELDDLADDDDDADTAALLRNAAAAGYRLSDDDLPDELLLEEPVADDDETPADDGWLPGLLEDEK